MRIAILAWEPGEHESVQLAMTARRLGHDSFLFDLDDVRARIPSQGGMDVWLGRRRLEDVDVVLSRVHLRPERWRSDEELLMLLSATGRPPVLHPAEIHIPVKSKLLLMQRLSAAGMPVPPTRFCRSVEEIATEMRQTGGPMVVKPAYGHGGHDVERLEGDPEAYRGTLQRLLDLHGGLLLQPYLEHPQGDVRATVIGDEVALSFRRIPPAGGWKTNIAAGGRAEVCTPSPAVRQLALDAASALKLTIAGLDIVDYGDRQIIFEANTSPGWYMLRSEEQEMVAEKCINHAIQYAMRARAAAA